MDSTKSRHDFIKNSLQNGGFEKVDRYFDLLDGISYANKYNEIYNKDLKFYNTQMKKMYGGAPGVWNRVKSTFTGKTNVQKKEEKEEENIVKRTVGERSLQKINDEIAVLEKLQNSNKSKNLFINSISANTRKKYEKLINTENKVGEKFIKTKKEQLDILYEKKKKIISNIKTNNKTPPQRHNTQVESQYGNTRQAQGRQQAQSFSTEYGNPQSRGYNPQIREYNPQSRGYDPQSRGYNPQSREHPRSTGYGRDDRSMFDE